MRGIQKENVNKMISKVYTDLGEVIYINAH